MTDSKLEYRMKSVQDNLTWYAAGEVERWKTLYNHNRKMHRIPTSLGFVRFMENPKRWCEVYHIEVV